MDPGSQSITGRSSRTRHHPGHRARKSARGGPAGHALEADSLADEAGLRHPLPAGFYAVCGNGALELRHRVAGAAGTDGLIPTTDRFGTSLGDIVRCSRCTHMQLDRLPPPGELSAAYAEAASGEYLEEEAGQRRSARELLEALERHTAPDALLEVGCWLGFLISEAQPRGWSVVGVEPSEFASRHARERLGLDVRTAELFDADLPAGRFDAVVLGDVIEHLPDPGGRLSGSPSCSLRAEPWRWRCPTRAARWLRAMGRRWGSVIPTHLHYFTRRSLSELLRRRGFEPLTVSTAPKAFTIRYYLGRIRGYAPRFSHALIRFAELAGLAERLWAPDFRDRMLVVARARD